MVVPVVVEVFVLGLEDAPIVRVLVRLEGVLPEEDPVPVFLEEGPGEAGLPAQVVEYCADLAMHVGVSVEELAESSQVVRIPTHVREHPRGVRVLGKHPVPLGHEVVEGRVPGAVVEASVREDRHLEPALVLVVERLEELGRISRVHEDGDAEPRGGLPDDVELGVVHLETGPVGLAGREPEALPDLADAHGAGSDVRLELRGDASTCTGPHGAEVERGEEDKAVGVSGGTDRLNLAREARPRAPPSLHDYLQVEAVHRRDHVPDGCWVVERRGVAMEVHRRELGSRDLVCGHDQRRAGLVVRDGGRRDPRDPGAPLGHGRSRDEKQRQKARDDR